MDAPYNFSYPGLNSPHRPGKIHAAATAEDQQKSFDPPGLTIVSFIRNADSYQLKNACARLHEAKPSFHSFTAALHLTFLTVLARKQSDELGYEQRRQIEREVAEVIESELKQIPQFAVTVQGIWSGGDFRCIEGNVVAAIDSKSRQRIEELSEQLIKKLKPQLTEICPGFELHPTKGGKITIGYYDESKDFYVDHGLAEALEEVCHVETQLWIEFMSLVRFRYKSLEDTTELLDPESKNNPLGKSGIVHKVQLQTPTDRPFRQATVKPKLLAMPRWVDWCGFSLLFDPPTKGSLVDHADTGIYRITCQPWSDPELGLFRAFGDALAEVGLDSTFNPYSFCPLPSTSYHCTVWDGINEENLSQITKTERTRFGKFLVRLPESARYTPPDLIPPGAFADIVSSAPMQFRFAGLAIWGDATLVARLAPVGEASKRLLEQIKERRAQLDHRFASMGRPSSSDYKPHVTLGYFHHPEGARAAIGNRRQWEKVFRERTAKRRIAFGSISAYGFTNMSTFLKLEFA